MLAPHTTTLLPSFLLLLLLPLLLPALPPEREALLDLKLHLSPLLSSWDPHTPHCSWRFVSCDPSSRVVSLHLPPLRSPPSTRLPRSIGRLTHLRSLSLPSLGLHGPIPLTLPSLLESLDLRFNSLSGPLPSSLPPRLRVLLLASNRLSGPIFPSLSSLRRLTRLDLSSNRLAGPIPAGIGRLRSLQVMDVSKNRLNGPLPAEIGSCTNLTVLALSTASRGEGNRFEGGGLDRIVPGLPRLRVLWAPGASLQGPIPDDWGACRSLEVVHLGGNALRGPFPRALAGCRSLRFLNLSSNELAGELDRGLPVPFMDVLDVSGNRLSGSIPEFDVCGLRRDTSDVRSSFYDGKMLLEGPLGRFGLSSRNAILHDFSRNNFTGSIPSLPIARDGSRVRDVYAFVVNGNKLTGRFPQHQLQESGPFSGGLVVDVSNNLLSGAIPSEIGLVCGPLVFLDASGNRLGGSIPESLGLCGALEHLDLSRNRLRGQIPRSLGLLSHLKHLSLAANEHVGGIPYDLARLPMLEVLNLSSNLLSGDVPVEFLKLEKLSMLLLNNRNLSGRLPMVTANATSIPIFDLLHNKLSRPVLASDTGVRCDAISGKAMLRPCRAISSFVHNMDIRGRSLEFTEESPPLGRSSGFSSIEIASISSAAAIVSVLLALIIIYIYTRRCAPRSKVQASGRKEVNVCVNIGAPLTYESVVRATGNFSASNCIGSGGFGATYKAEIAPGVIVAIKRLFTGKIQGMQHFNAEIKTLKRWRHPNLVTLIGYHASEVEMFLIYNYLPGGNLEKFINSRCKRPVDWRVLHKIALDVARALAYLHDQCVPRILHRDVKPSNILLDNDYNAYLSDFGLARLLGNSETHATTGVAGTFGYVAPEYAMTCRVSDKADVYSYGVVLLELLSDKKALDPSFSRYGNGFNIVAWASMLLKKGKACEFFTEGLWDVGPSDDLIATLHLALKCTNSDIITNRPTMKQVAQQLRRIQP